MNATHKTILGLVVFASLGSLVGAEDSDLVARMRHIEPGVMVQRALEAGSEEAEVNLPFLPGDRAWTDASGRAEVQFSDGSLLWLNQHSKLDFIGLDDRATLRLWSGALFLRVLSSNASFTIETTSAAVKIDETASVRIDVRNGETRVSTYEGAVTLETESGQRDVRAGQRADARGGMDTEVDLIDTQETDAFGLWVADRESEIHWSGANARHLPSELAPYAEEFDAYGTWRQEADLGYVWYPQVDDEWSPYAEGRWIWTTYGWTWVPRERWGWATCHYGRWDFSVNLGWYWIPARTWGPAWVSWSIGHDYVGWCPLSRHNRPILFSHHNRYRGLRLRDRFDHGAWRFARRGDFGSRGFAKRRDDHFAPNRSRIAAYSNGQRHPSRDFSRWERPQERSNRVRFSRASAPMTRQSRRPVSAFSSDRWSRSRDGGRLANRSSARLRDQRYVVGSSRPNDASRRSSERLLDSARSDRRGSDTPYSARRNTSRRYDWSTSSRSSDSRIRDRQPSSRVYFRRETVERRQDSDRGFRSERPTSGSRNRETFSRSSSPMTRSYEQPRRERVRSESRPSFRNDSPRHESQRSSSAERRAPSRSSRGGSEGSHDRSARRRR